MNHENAPRYHVRFNNLTAAEMDELVSLVAREAGGNTFDAMKIQATLIQRGVLAS